MFCQTFLLNANFFFPEYGLSIADNNLNIHKVLCVYLNRTCLFDRKIYRKIGCFEMLSSGYKERILASICVHHVRKNKIEDIKLM